MSNAPQLNHMPEPKGKNPDWTDRTLENYIHYTI